MFAVFIRGHAPFRNPDFRFREEPSLIIKTCGFGIHFSTAIVCVSGEGEGGGLWAVGEPNLAGLDFHVEEHCRCRHREEIKRRRDESQRGTGRDRTR
ncbi:hypothetical protein JMJ77_0008313 [Colletotrichum scovillei]|uniref:Uncharacterized protein n=1 Tax=Colletotrichum scovillei TaxID=1209932 RepID=A0A9P7RDY5_9PEZI|nr:hypothetical protein JMJ77_0008313 [Colletotrichum scovillei]KAG7075343.1 hypothetical protein JMJ76_0011803 [Colletotrichum scovillei]KAG7082587.1 hypothetical protein JMJ78_0004688 [Colletotrichum scovillei]